jgi:hypothetical protein
MGLTLIQVNPKTLARKGLGFSGFWAATSSLAVLHEAELIESFTSIHTWRHHITYQLHQADQR